MEFRRVWLSDISMEFRRVRLRSCGGRLLPELHPHRDDRRRQCGPRGKFFFCRILSGGAHWWCVLLHVVLAVSFFGLNFELSS
jgi:hypothetical protein